MNRAVLGLRLIMIFFAFLIMGLILDFPFFDTPIKIRVKEAEAVVGRPATPASVGGVRRRTRRRTRRRWAIGTRMYTLPAGYTTTKVYGATYYVVDGEYMKKAYEGDKVVYVVVDDPNKTATDNAGAQTQPAQSQPAQAQPSSKGTAEQKLLELKNYYDKGLIDKEEYETKKNEILDSM